jgi:hypothetical protein
MNGALRGGNREITPEKEELYENYNHRYARDASDFDSIADHFGCYHPACLG